MSQTEGFLLDTSILLETLRTRPAMAVMEWMESVDQDRLFISALTIGELMAALEQVGDADRRTALMRWILMDMQAWFKGKILTLTPEVSAFWGSLAGKFPRDVPVVTGLQAAFALKHGLALVTREVISVPHLSVINPWVKP